MGDEEGNRRLLLKEGGRDMSQQGAGVEGRMGRAGLGAKQEWRRGSLGHGESRALLETGMGTFPRPQLSAFPLLNWSVP